MKERCPSASFVGGAMLPDHRLAFSRKSKKRQCGVADVVAAASCQVWGVVFEISDLDLRSLDKSEGYRPGRLANNSYVRRECRVLLDGDDNRSLTVSTYFAEREATPPAPNQAYMRQILAGARYWHLPAAYISDLERIEVRG